MIQYKRSYSEGESIEFDATLYNAAGELINEPEVRLNIYNEEKKSFDTLSTEVITPII